MNSHISKSVLEEITSHIGTRTIVLVGLMGAGKTTIGRRLAKRLGLPFLDADHEIEQAAGMSVSEIFETHGEAHFRDGERKVIERLLKKGPQILATGGGAWLDPRTRDNIRQSGICIWLKGDLDLLMQRVMKRSTRPLLKTANPEATMKKLMDERYPVYAKADIHIESANVSHNAMVNNVLNGIVKYMKTTKSADDNSAIVNVDLGERAYPIHIGLGVLENTGKLIKPLLRRNKLVIVTDENVAREHLKTLGRSLDEAAIEHQTIILPPGESTKSYKNLISLCDELLALGVERNDVIVAFGGGVIGDITGFAAAIIRRGVDFIQIPTSLLAQVDSSVGGKTGINTSHGKNLIGAFHQPLAVIADIAVLDTLPPRHLANGYAEVVKYGLLGDHKFFHWLEENADSIFSGNAQARIKAISASCEAKADIVARDEKESGIRARLNLGHTFGHALEAATGFSDRLLHGEGVAIGMVLAYKFCEQQKLVEPGTATRVANHLKSINLPTGLQDIKGDLPDAERLVEYMRQDKKARNGKLVFILVKSIGEAYVETNVDEADILKFMTNELASR